MTSVRALAFGDPEGACWGAAWLPDGAPTMLALGAGADAEVHSASLSEGEEPEDWRLSTDDAELLVSPLAELSPADHRDAPTGVDQLCRVTGRVRSTSGEGSVDRLGWRAQRAFNMEEKRLASLRQVSAWFDHDEGVALLAVRPPKADGQDADVVTAALLEPRLTGRVSDPRLSTTYGEHGHPTRAGVELWIGEEAPGTDGEEPASQQYPRRLSGEAVGARVDWVVDGIALHAALFRWHFRNHDGAGVYLLGLRR